MNKPTDTAYILAELTRIKDSAMDLGNGPVIESRERLQRLFDRITCLIEDIRKGARP